MGDPAALIGRRYAPGVRRLVVLAACCGLAVPASAAAASAPPLAKYVLRPAQVGKGYGLYARKDGFGLGTRTLDLCGVTGYPSEKLRTGRLQVDYLKRKTTLGLSNEVVTYRPGGTAQALREVTRHALRCPRNRPVDPGEQGLPPLHYAITRLHDRRLLSGYLAVKVRVTGTVKGKHVDDTSYAVYQRYRNVLSGVYSFGPNTTEQLRFCLHAAEQSARDLRGPAPAAQGPTA